VRRPTTFAHRLEYLALQMVAQSFGNLPLEMGTGAGAAFARFVGMRTGLRRRADKNLAFALPDLTEAERRTILVEMFDNFCRTAFEYQYLKRLSTEAGRFEITGLEHLEAARERGQGAILTSGHFGNWEMIRIAFARHGWPPALIYRAFNNPLFDAYSMRLMRTTDAPLFHKGKRGTLGLLRHVRKGGCALILTDQRFSKAPEIPFFGWPAKTSLGAAEIAINFGPSLLPVHCSRIGRSNRFIVEIEPPLPAEGRTPEDLTADINARLESWVREKPEQYFWMHNRWAKDPQKRSRQ